jgi:conjugal transfer/entry exclusion protein
MTTDPPPPPPPTPTSTQTHPALTVPNISNFIKITLSMEKGTYNTWSELFKIHARVFQVIDHIIPSTEPSATRSLKTTDPSLWRRLDAVVLQWIYGTISEDLLNTIIEHDSTAETAWNRLFDIFYDNKNSRALYLEQEFSRTRMEQFSDASSYCQHLKSLSDQLANVGTPISNERLVLQLISGLTDAYAAVGSQIRHADTLPQFYKARSMIILEETALQKKVSNSVDNTALMASNNETSTDGSSSRPNRGGSNNNHGGRSNGRGHRGRGRGRNHGRGRGRFPQQQWPSPYC